MKVRDGTMTETDDAAISWQRETWRRWENTPRKEKSALFDELIQSDNALWALELFSRKILNPLAQYEFVNTVADCTFFKRKPEGKAISTIAAYNTFVTEGAGGTGATMVALSQELGNSYRSIIITEADYGAGKKCDKLETITLESLTKETGSRLSAFASVLSESKVDVLLYNDWFGDFLVWDVILCAILNIKVVLNIHGVFSHFLDVSNGTFASWNDGRFFALVPKVAALCDAVVGQTAVNKCFFKQFNPNTYEIKNTLPKRYAQQEITNSKINADSSELLWVGRFDIFKHPEDAILILDKVAKTHPEVKLTFVGKSGYETYEQELESLANSLNLTNHISFEGFQENVDKYYSHAGVLLLTSEVEGYCMVLAEACAHGLPIVAYDLPYLPFAKCKGIEWVAQGDIQGAADQICSILSSTKKRMEMASASLSYTTQNSEDSWTEVLEDLAIGKKNSCDSTELDTLLWNTLFSHYLKGANRAHDEISKLSATIARQDEELNKERETRGILLDACRNEYEQSYSYRIGRALLTLPRLAAKPFRGKHRQ